MTTQINLAPPMGTYHNPTSWVQTWTWGEARLRRYPSLPLAYARACREAFRRVRRDVWSERESRLVAKWESYG
jgi:hypothetical protein